MDQSPEKEPSPVRSISCAQSCMLLSQTDLPICAESECLWPSIDATIHKVAISFSSLTSSEIEEVIADAKLLFWENLPKFQGQSKITTWVHTIAQNAALQFIRKNQRRKKVLGEFVNELVIRHSSSNNQDIIRVLENCLASLDTEQLSFLSEIYWHGKTRREVSSESGIQYYRLARYIQNTLQQLKACMDRADL